jgi:hypothetical protein
MSPKDPPITATTHPETGTQATAAHPRPQEKSAPPLTFHPQMHGTVRTLDRANSLAGLARSRSSLHVMTAASIPATRGGDYARYLEGKTIAPERGDYYLTPDGEMTQAAGQWLADPQTLKRLGVRPDGPADGEDFVSLMEGRHPQTGSG